MVFIIMQSYHLQILSQGYYLQTYTDIVEQGYYLRTHIGRTRLPTPNLYRY